MIASGVQAYLESLDVDVAEGEALFRLLQRLGKNRWRKDVHAIFHGDSYRDFANNGDVKMGLLNLGE
jgi:hypothetical protein